MSGRILIVDEMMINRIVFAARLAPAAHDIENCASAETALAAVRARMPDLVLISENLPDHAAYGLCRSLRTLPGGAALPIALIGDTSDRAMRLAALEAGIDTILHNPPQTDILLARVRNLLRRGGAEAELLRNDESNVVPYALAERAQQAFETPGQITLIAPNVAQGMRWRNALMPLMRDRIDVLNPARALTELNGSGQPDAIVIAASPADRGGALRLLSDLRCRADTHNAAILLMQDRPDPELTVMALDLGVTDIVETGFDTVEMVLRLRRELARKARGDHCRGALRDSLRLAATDPLTGLYNRRYAMSELGRVQADCTKGTDGFAVMVLDLDRFKTINDTFGHAAGDTVLSEVSTRMAACLRDCDFLARIGGEEFLAVIRNCDSAAAAHAAERLRRVVSDQPVELGGTAVTVTLSIGLLLCDAALCADHADPAQLVNLADKALYAAKADGRNQVSLHQTAA